MMIYTYAKSNVFYTPAFFYSQMFPVPDMVKTIQDSQQKAKQQYEAAFHLMHSTFSTVNDPKLLLGIIHNLVQAQEHAIEAVLAYERQLRLVPPYPNSQEFKFNLFREKTARRNKIPAEYTDLLLNLKEIITLEKKGPVEFQRGDRYVLSNKNYLLKSVSPANIKDYLDQTKAFLSIINKIIKIEQK